MSWDNWKWSEMKSGWELTFSPNTTREGVPMNKAAERVAIEKVGGANTIRQESGGALRTRNNFPLFYGRDNPVDVVQQYRGFVYNKGEETTGKIFNCYSIEQISDTQLVRLGYAVAGFKSNTKILAPDWAAFNDVWIIRGNGILVNGLSCATLALPDAPAEQTMLPYIFTGQNGEYYGTDADRKKAFYIGRYTAQGPQSSVEVLTPSTPRSDKKALPYGQKIDGSGAWLHQLWYTGYSWDDPTGGWSISECHIALADQSPYLQKVSSSATPVAPSCVPGALQGFSNPAAYVQRGAGNVPVTIKGYYSGMWYDAFNHAYRIPAVASHVFRGTLHWGVTRSDSGSMAEKSSSGTFQVFGENVSFASSVLVKTSSYSENFGWPEQLVPLPYNYNADVLYKDSGGDQYPLKWMSDLGPQHSAYGKTSSTGNYESQGLHQLHAPAFGSANVALGTENEYSGQFSAMFAGYPLMQGNFTRLDRTGETTSATENPDLEAQFSVFYGSTINEKSSGQTSWITLDQLHELVAPRVASWEGQEVIAASPPLYFPHYFNHTYTAWSAPSTSELNWTTTDFLLMDETNATRIYLRSEFAAIGDGSSSSANLSCKLKIETPDGNAETTLFTWSGGLGNFLWLTEELPNHVPIPRVSAFPIAMYYHQGNFCGGAYVESGEEADSATVFKFNLRIRNFSEIGALNPSKHEEVVLIPANLLEMLYAYVFSDKFGQDDYERYPITRTSVFNWFSTNVFNTGWNIEFKDGSLSSWSATFGDSGTTHIDLGRI